MAAAYSGIWVPQQGYRVVSFHPVPALEKRQVWVLAGSACLREILRQIFRWQLLAAAGFHDAFHDAELF